MPFPVVVKSTLVRVGGYGSIPDSSLFAVSPIIRTFVGSSVEYVSLCHGGGVVSDDPAVKNRSIVDRGKRHIDNSVGQQKRPAIVLRALVKAHNTINIVASRAFNTSLDDDRASRHIFPGRKIVLMQSVQVFPSVVGIGSRLHVDGAVCPLSEINHRR